MTTLNEAVALHGRQVEAATAAVNDEVAQEQAEIAARETVAASDPFKIVEARAETLAQAAVRVTTSSGDISEILKAQGAIRALKDLMHFYTHAEVESRTARQQDG